jgi:membrane protein
MAEEQPAGTFAARVKAVRERFPAIDRVLRVQDHYTQVQGGVLASSATYFGFLSFFPLLALAFAVVGFVSESYPDAHDSLVTAIEQLFPGIVSETGEQGTISLQQIENAKVTVGIIGFVGVLYSGLGWISGLRTALTDAFAVPREKARNFVVGKAVDVVTLVILGVTLIASVGVAAAITGWAQRILEFVNLDDTALGGPLIWTVGALLGVAFSTLLFFVMFHLLGNPPIPRGSVWQGALVAAVGFEALKILVVNVIGAIGGSAFAPLAIAITLVVWINYFSKLAVYGACWAMTTRHALEAATEGGKAAQRDLPWSEDTAMADPGASRPVSTGDDAVPAPATSRLDAGSAVLGAAAGFGLAKLLDRRTPRSG